MMDMSKEEELINAGFRKRTNYENTDVYKVSSILYGLVIFVGGVYFSISHAIVPRKEADIIKRLAEIYFTYLYWASIFWIIFCIFDIIHHRHKVKIRRGTFNQLESSPTNRVGEFRPIPHKLTSSASEPNQKSSTTPIVKLKLFEDSDKEQMDDNDDVQLETDSNKTTIENEESFSIRDHRSQSRSLDDLIEISSAVKPQAEFTRDISTRRHALDSTAQTYLKAYVRRRRNSIVQHVIGYNYDDNSIVGGLYTRVGIGIFCLGTVIHSSLSILSNLENCQCTCWTAVMDDFSRLLFSFLQFFFVFKHSNLIIRAHENLARVAVIHIVVTNLCVWFRMVVIETMSQIEEVNGLHVTVTQYNNTASYAADIGHQTINVLHRLLLSSECLNMNANEMRSNSFIREGYIKMKPLLYPCTIEFSLMCLTLFFLIWENIGKTFTHKISNKESTKNIFMVNCHASVKGLFVGMIFFSFTMVSILLYAVFRNKIGDNAHSASSSSVDLFQNHAHSVHTNSAELQVQHYSISPIASGTSVGVYGPLDSISNTSLRVVHGIVILESVNLCLLTLSLCATIWALIKIRRLNYHRTTTRFDDVLIIVSLTGIYLYSTFSFFAIISSLGSSTWIVYIKLAIVILEFIEGTVHALFILLALRKTLRRTSKHKYPAREIITLLIMLDLSLWFEKTTTTTKHEANPFQLAFYHVIPWSIIAAIATPLQIFFRFHASVCLSHVWTNIYHLPLYEPAQPREFS